MTTNPFPENTPVDFLIIGGGIAGLAMAIRLADMSFKVRVLEQAPQLGEVGAGLSIWGAGQHALMRLGLGETLHRQAMDWASYEMWIGSRLAVARPTPALSLEDGIGPWIVTRAALHQTLLGGVPNEVEIALDAKVQTITETDEGVKITTHSGTTHQARYVIGADGQNSVTRKACGDQKPLTYSGYVCYRGLAENHVGLAANHGVEFFGAKGLRVGLFALPENALYWFAFVNSKQQNLPMADTLPAFKALHPMAEKLFDEIDQASVIENPIQHRKPFKPGKQTPKRMALVGDAAHPNQPSLGMGASAALVDVMLLADLIAQARDNIPDAIAHYYKQSVTGWQKAHRRHNQLGRMGQGTGVAGQWAFAASIRLTTKGA